MEFVHRRRRGAELFLLVLALAVGVGAYAAVGLGVEGEVPTDILAYGGWLAGLVIVAHVVVRFVAPYADPVLLPGRGRPQRPRPGRHPPARPGLDHHLRPPAADLDDPRGRPLRGHPGDRCATTGSCSGSPTPAGWPRSSCCCCRWSPGSAPTINGARIWIHLGPFSFQPGEVAKLLLVITFAGYLVLHRDALALAGRRVLFVDLPRGRDLGPILLMWLVSLGILVFQPTWAPACCSSASS